MYNSHLFFRNILIFLLIKEHPNSGCSSIIELSCFHRPCESDEKTTGNQNAETDQHEYHFHYSDSAFGICLAFHVVIPKEKPITVSELTGMSIAVNSGVRSPIKAKVNPIALYINDMMKAPMMTLEPD